VTTDYPAVQRALELSCDALMVAKHGVDGVYDRDPRRFPDARRYTTLSYVDAIKSEVKVMDQSALILARDYELPLHVFNFSESGAMAKICTGEAAVGSYISSHSETRFA
jgi:uridylate kinase